jgi:hypothetical protein
MPNVLDAEPLRALVRRAGKKVPEGSVRTRFERLAFAHFLSDERNLCPAHAYDICIAADWAREAAERGEQLFLFKLDRSTTARVHNVARRLGAACALAAIDTAKQPHLTHAIAEARRLIAKINHTGFDVMAEKARWLARAYAHVEAESDFDAQCEERAVTATCKRTWRRVTSVAQLHAVGREFRNCLARAPHAQHHACRLRDGSHQYWVLRDFEGVGLVVAMADAPLATHFAEVRGPRNSTPRGHSSDLAVLAVAIGLKTDPPPPPPPPGLAAFLALARAQQPPCPCRACMRMAHLPRMARAL